MNNINPLFKEIFGAFGVAPSGALNAASTAPVAKPVKVTLRGGRSEALNDMAVIREMKQTIRDKLRDAVAACYSQAVSLQGFDPDVVMELINKQFSPDGAMQGDCFSDAFFEIDAAISDVVPSYRGEP